MTGAEIIAAVGGVVWIVERVFSWFNKKDVAKKVKKIHDKMNGGMEPPPDLKDMK